MNPLRRWFHLMHHLSQLLEVSIIQEAKMNQHLIDLQASVATLTVKVDGLLASHSAPSPTEADLDAIKTTVDALTAKITAVVP